MFLFKSTKHYFLNVFTTMVVATRCSRITTLLYAYCGENGTHFTMIFLKARHPLPTGTDTFPCLLCTRSKL